MRDRLIDLIEGSRYWGSGTSEEIADHLLANGVIVPPCKVGQTGYFISGIHGTLIKEAKVEEIYYGEDIFAFRMSTDYTYFDLQENEVYFTREEAEKALAERSENGT